MNHQKKIHAAYYVIEGMNSFATVIFFNYLYFYFRDQFGFDNKHNLALAALIGLIYAIASWQAGKFAHRYGNFFALKIGFIVMAGGLLAGAQIHSMTGVIIAACIANIGMCFTWPVLEALVSEGETPAHVPHAVGLYNIVWAATNALAFFIGGTLVEKIRLSQHFLCASDFFRRATGAGALGAESSQLNSGGKIENRPPGT